MSLSLAMAYHKGDRAQVIRWMEWVKELGGLGQHKLFTLPAFDCDPVPDILPSVRLKDDYEITSDWQSNDGARSAAAPNSMFRAFAWHFYHQKLGPWMFVEPDCVPLKKDWIEQLEAEYARGGKHFMGAHVVIPKVPEHMSGNAIYSQDTPQLAPLLVMQTLIKGTNYELAFDVAGAPEVLPQAHFTNLIQHVFRHKGFKSRFEFDDMIDPAAVVFHSNKSGDIFPYLRGETPPSLISDKLRVVFEETKNLSGGVEASHAGDVEGGLVPCKVLSTVKLAACGSSDPPAQTFSQMPKGKDFPFYVKYHSAHLAALADSPYHRRKVRDSLKKAGLI